MLAQCWPTVCDAGPTMGEHLMFTRLVPDVINDDVMRTKKY